MAESVVAPDAAPAAAPPDTAALRACLFIVGGDRFAVEVRQARGVVVFDDATAVPGAPSYVLGITNLRGRLVPVLDLRTHLRLSTPWRGRGRAAKALVIEHASLQVAVAIDDVVGLEAFDAAQALSEAERRRYGDFAIGRLPRRGGPFTLLDAPRIIEALRIRAAGTDDEFEPSGRTNTPAHAAKEG
jgi:chemotaxis signal transduction protein